MGIGFTDIVAMAKSGWTPEQVNNMLDRFEAMNAKEEEKNESDSKEENEAPANEKDDAATTTEKHDDTDSSETDEKDKRIAELESQVQKLQQDNSHQNNDSGEKKSLDDLVDDIFKEFYD
jgi:hypothetical protein